MNTTNIKRTIKGLGLASAMVFGMVMFASSDANAQYRGDRGRDNANYGNQGRNDDYNRNSRVSGREIKAAYERGYQQGLDQGFRDARSRRGSNGGYINNGNYNGGFGNNYQIREAFQKGFDKGYRDGLKRGRNSRRGSIWPF